MHEVANALPSGYVLQEYRVESVLGAGGFGVTYLATDSNLDLEVALKEYLPSDFAARTEDSTVQPKPGDATATFLWGLQRFMDEAKTLASFRHSSIVRVLRFFEANRTAYMVMEFIEGKPLSEWMAARRPLPQQTLLELVSPLLDGLEIVHGAGYLHRDIKPENIVIREDGSVVLIDFGSARQLLGGNQELTAVMSPGYAPLEQYHSLGNQGPWTDLYAIGGVLYWMLTGNKPIEAAARVRTDVLPSTAKTVLGSGYTADLLAAVDWALRPHEDDRPQSVVEFRRALMGAQRKAALEPTVSEAASDATVILKRPASGGMTGLSGIALDHEQLERMEGELLRHIGPIAAVLVRNAAKNAHSIDALAEAIASEIADDKERTAFVRKFAAGNKTTPPSGLAQSPAQKHASSVQMFTAETLQRAQVALAQHIGAVAKVVVKRAAAKARDEAELYRLLAEEIKEPADREEFRRKVTSVSGST